jgi:hypothetical protein
MTVKHLARYVDEFAARQNALNFSIPEQIGATLSTAVGKTLPYLKLVSNDKNDN